MCVVYEIVSMFFCSLVGSFSPFVALWGSQPKRKTALLDFKGHTARFLIILCHFANLWIAAAVCKQPVFQIGVMGADMDDWVFLVKVNVGGLFFLC